ncbi:nitronate monooxygenase [Micromonospora sp. 4G57]|uniref:Propionate 3-nitronate monooxygenase n=1 Tax=Micromonospora sicca TaxID=2202420 RepID=A0ABU5J6F9_9ACTN|nr:MULTISPECIES: nitronate monooxygenase [unclassified Micromonospora]MDZ5443119.1 nitronate monooxygenase [Micromonospora sp. 4G57]MDZ5488169.1 nitronate monooxygenase [Micromonospora sp. 4G53]
MDTERSALLGVDLPVVAAPMAGGPTTPRLVTAVGSCGAFAFLAAGYRAPEAVAEEIAAARADGRPFGVNVFVPTPVPVDEAEFRRYAARIADEGRPYGLDLAAAPRTEDDDHWADKIALLVDDPVPVVSFTFGLPPAAVVRDLRRAGSRVLMTVTDPAEAAAAADLGVDGLVAQSGHAGGHYGTFTPHSPTPVRPLAELVGLVGARTGLPVLAAGGVGGAEDVRAALTAGATAVLVGTLLLRADESGASRSHGEALADPRRDRTVVTRAFTGRPARGLRNDFIDRYEADAPLGYPALHHLTRPLRKAAAEAGDADRLHLWAGTGWRGARAAPAADILAELTRPL